LSIENTIAVLIMNIVLGRQLRAARVLAGLAPTINRSGL
jgi:hypothetical protein